MDAAQDVKECQAKYCPPQGYQILIDTPINTMNKDGRLGGPTLAGAYAYTKQQYYNEALVSPGVRAVSQSVVHD